MGILFGYTGLPPMLMTWLLVWEAQVRVLSAVIIAQCVQNIERQRHQHLPPGEQYRRHMRAGGYRP